MCIKLQKWGFIEKFKSAIGIEMLCKVASKELSETRVVDSLPGRPLSIKFVWRVSSGVYFNW